MSDKSDRHQAALKAVPENLRIWLGQAEREKIAALCDDARNSPALIANEVARDARLRMARAELRNRGCFDIRAHDAACAMIFQGADPNAAVDAALAQTSPQGAQAAHPQTPPGAGPKSDA